MGIRFTCPNGHKLNVKEFLAGKRAVCPHCGAKFTIPAADVAADRPIAGTLAEFPAGGDLGSASMVIPTLETLPGPLPAATNRPAAALPGVVPPVIAIPPPAGSHLAGSVVPRRRNRPRTQLLIAILMLMIVIVLVFVLVWVLSRNPNSESAPPTDVAECSRCERLIVRALIPRTQ